MPTRLTALLLVLLPLAAWLGIRTALWRVPPESVLPPELPLGIYTLQLPEGAVAFFSPNQQVLLDLTFIESMTSAKDPRIPKVDPTGPAWQECYLGNRPDDEKRLLALCRGPATMEVLKSDLDMVKVRIRSPESGPEEELWLRKKHVLAPASDPGRQ